MRRCAPVGGWRLAILLAALASGRVAAETPAPAAVLQTHGYESVSLRRTGQNHWFLFGRVDGRRRSCLVDTGWAYTTVSTNTAARLAAPNQIERLELGGIVLSNMPVRASDLRVNGQPTAYDVVLGCDFLLAHQAVLDFRSARLYLRRNPATDEDQAALTAAFQATGRKEVGVRLQIPPALTVRAAIRETNTELLVDSGAMWSCLDAQLALRAGLRTAGSVHRMSGPGAGGQRNFAVADLPVWSLDSHRMPERTMAVLDLSDWGLGAKAKLFPQVEGILGGAELLATEAWLDCGQLKLWVRPAR